MIVSLATVFQHPLGVGYDAFYAARNAFGSGLVAASLLAYAAVYGIIPWLQSLLETTVTKFENIIP